MLHTYNYFSQFAFIALGKSLNFISAEYITFTRLWHTYAEVSFFLFASYPWIKSVLNSEFLIATRIHRKKLARLGFDFNMQFNQQLSDTFNFFSVYVLFGNLGFCMFTLINTPCFHGAVHFRFSKTVASATSFLHRRGCNLLCLRLGEVIYQHPGAVGSGLCLIMATIFPIEDSWKMVSENGLWMKSW